MGSIFTIHKHFGEIVLVVSGLMLLGGLVGVANTESFAVWTIAKILYGTGVVLFFIQH
jgi:hypothetical protein